MSNNQETKTYPDVAGHNGTDTSIEAAKKIEIIKKDLHWQVIKLLRQYPGGLNFFEIVQLLNIGAYNIHPRLTELRDMGEIIDSGNRRDGRVKSKATVWIINPNPGVPQPRKRNLKALGNKELWGEMLRSIYAHSAVPDMFNHASMEKALKTWALDFSEKIRLGRYEKIGVHEK